MTKLVQMLQKKEMSLIVSLPSNNYEVFQAAVEGGADSIKIHFNVDHRASGNHFLSVDHYKELIGQMVNSFSGPLGAVVGDALHKVTKEEVDRLAEAGFDFISLYTKHAPGWLCSERRLNRMLAVDNNYTDQLIASFRSMPIEVLEASIIPGEEYGTSLSIHDLLNYRHLTELAGKPVVVPSQRKIEVHDLAALQTAGVQGVMIGAIVTGTEAQSIYEATKKMRQELDRLAG
ncbi:hypothetical protein [Paenibacillus sp. GXUN7292]|uniref:hypothetical protein n=1 Tax=Paenibacillus sp. GXUN7292 TaxID=3422499 RepID=UPI003D7C4EB4